MEETGGKVVAIDYQTNEESLLQLLPHLSGVLLTGGNIDFLVHPETKEQHPYYKTVRTIAHYAMRLKDEKGEDFPIIGVCQGFQILTMIVAGDEYTLEDILIRGENRKKTWKVANPKTDSVMFSKFEDDLIRGFESDPYCVHFHQWAISTPKFNSYPGLAREFKILQTDTLNDVEFVCAYEGVRYPFYAVLYHPEYQTLPSTEMFKFNNCDETLRIYKHLSQLVFDKAQSNSNRLPDGLYPQKDIPSLLEVENKQLAERNTHKFRE